LLFTTCDHNQAEEQGRKEDEVLQDGHGSILLYGRKLKQFIWGAERTHNQLASSD
jgi:hypothetical protein